MAYPVRPVNIPTVLSGQRNGQLPAGILIATPGLNGGPVVRLVAPAARAWRALAGTAQDAGIVLQATSLVDSYRPYDVQYATFHQRYTTQRNTDWDIKVCGGTTYYQKPGTAAAACPGTSNHGYGLAVDIADAEGKRLEWLLANELRFGFSHELQSESWHIHYFAGDAIPPAVLAFEEDDMADNPALTDCLSILTAMAAAADTAKVHDKDGVLDLTPFYDRIAEEAAAKVLAGLPAGGSSADHTHDIAGKTGPAQPA